MKEKQKASRKEGDKAKTDMEIVSEVLNDKNKSSTFLASMGVSSSSRQKSISHEHIRELEHRLAAQELAIKKS